MRTKRFLPLLLGLAACGDTQHFDPGQAYGELGVGIFLYQCPTSGDPFCPGGTTVSDQFPQAFALGGHISFLYDWRDNEDHIGDPLPQLQTASPDRLARQGETFTALVTGYAAVLAVTGNSEVVDLVHLYISEISELRVVTAGQPGASPLLAVTLEAGATEELQALALNTNAVTLGGVFGHTWATSDAAVVDIVAGIDSGRAQIQGIAAGTATLTLTHGELRVDIKVTIEPGEPGPTTGDTDTTDSSSSTGDTDTDTTGDTDDGTTGDTDTGTTGDSTTGDSTTGDSTGTTGGAL